MGISVSAASFGIANGLSIRAIESILGISPHIKVVNSKLKIDNYRDVITKIDANAIGKCCSKAILKRKLFKSTFSEGVLIEGYEASALKKKGIHSKIIKGNIFNDSNEIMVGRELAKKLALGIGTNVEVVSDNNKVQKYRVCGIFHSGLYEYDSNLCIIPLSSAQDLLTMDNNEVNEIEIILDNPFAAATKSKEIESKIRLVAKPWHKLNEHVLRGLNLEKAILSIFLFLLILFAGFVVNGAMSELIRSKRREIATLKAIGFSNLKIFNTFVLLSIIIFCTSFLTSIFLFFLLKFFILKYGFILISDIYYIADTIPFSLTVSQYLQITGFAFFITLLAIIKPLINTLNQNISEVIKYE